MNASSSIWKTRHSPMHLGRMASVFLSLFLVATVCRPASGEYQIFWGDVHGHTSHSDGKGSLDDYFTHARDVARLDFAIVSDHDFGNSAPWRMTKETWTLTQDKADEYTVDGCFVAIAGYEWTSQPKYWTDVEEGAVSERLFPGSPKFYNHKNVYFLGRVDYLFNAKDQAYMSPDLLAAAVLRHGGLIHNNHPSVGTDGANQWDYKPVYDSVIANTEIDADSLQYEGKTYEVGVEQIVRGFLNRGRKTGFVKGTDTHDGTPAARTAILATELTREAIFDALRHRRTYAVTNARIALSFKIDGHEIGEEIGAAGRPKIDVDVQGTDRIGEVAIVRDGAVIHSLSPATARVKFTYVDKSFRGNSYYYVRVTQVDKDKHGNRSRAWSSPIWVKSKVSGRSPP
jgi:hypothetical protein